MNYALPRNGIKIHKYLGHGMNGSHVCRPKILHGWCCGVRRWERVTCKRCLAKRRGGKGK